MDETRRLADFVTTTQFDDLPGEVVEAMRRYFMDDLASGFAGCSTSWAAMVMELAQENGGAGDCTIFAQPWRASPPSAALINGVMIGGFETDHGFGPGSCHPSAAVVPAVLAVAEREHLDGKTFLTAMALGYEALCRIGAAATRAVEDERGFHGPGTNGPFGAAVGVGKALAFNSNQMANALGIAGSHGCGLKEFFREGAMTKRLHLGRATQTGLESALLAAKGFTGPTTVLEGECGFLQVYSPSPQPERLLEGLGKTYLMKNIGLKSYATHGTCQAVLQGLSRFKEEVPFDPAAVERVRVTGSGWMVTHHDDQEPTSLMGVQYSLPFSVAIGLARDFADPRAFGEETLWDPQVRALAKRVEVRADVERFGREGSSRADVELHIGGTRHSFQVDGVKGSPNDPFTFAEVCDKFRRYAGPYLEAGRIEEVVRGVEELEGQPDVSRLIRLLGK